MRNEIKSLPNRIISLISALSVIASLCLFSSCAVLEKSSAIKIDTVEISDDVTAYFLDKASSEIDFSQGRKAIKDKTVSLVEHYFKTNTLAYAHHLKLSVEEKAEVSERVSAVWSIYGSYYKKIGVRRDTLTKIFTADVYRDKLILAYYSTGGTQEIPESRIFASFKTNYVIFQAITGYFTTTDLSGNTIRIPKDEMETLVLKFQNMKDMVNSGEHDMIGAADYLTSTGVQCSVQTVILHKDDDTYPAGFFNKVQTIDTRQSTVIASNDYIFLILRGEAGIGSDYFNSKKIEIIKSIVGDDIDGIIDGAYKYNHSVDNSVFNSYYSLIEMEKKTDE